MANILGINLSELNQSEVLKKITDFLNDGKQHYIVTPNPEIILAASKDEEFFYILNEADLALADGFGLKIAGWLFGANLPRVTGADTTIELLKMAAKDGAKVMILNWENGLSQPDDIKTALEKKFPDLVFSILNISRDKLLSNEAIEKINQFAPAILFNTLGFPYQEKLIYHNIKQLPSVKVALGIGGSFDFITGKAKRAPKIFRSLGLEWFWRLIISLFGKNSWQRIKRVYRATFVFIWQVIKGRFIYPLFYRKNVACFLYKKNGDKFEVLIVERTDQPGHWQLPQGGTDGEALEVAGSRELREELGTDKIIVRATFKNVYRYKFKDRDNYVIVKSRKYIFNHKGQSQGLLVAEFTGNDSDIKINFWDHRNWQWIETDKLITTVHQYRKVGCEKFLEKFQSLNLK
jgi:N-acetylglucosaminyldiphosphoundecaprenol N-acetyl-beta-D-mannosaminyltransferase